MTKSTKKQHESDENPLEITRRVLVDGLTRLETEISGGHFDRPTEFAQCLTRVAQVQAELRKADAEDRRRSDTLSAASVIEWFRAIPQSERETVLPELVRIAQKRSTLA